MKVHFFTRLNSPNRSAFRNYSTLQNLRTIKTVSLVYFLLNITLRLVVVIFDLPIKNLRYYDEFNDANIISSIITPAFYLISIVLIHFFEQGDPKKLISYIFSLSFALFVIITGMRATFFTMHNPRNTLVMYLVGIVVAGVFFTFEYFESIILCIITAAVFSIMLPYYQAGVEEIIMNNLASVVMLTLFYCISRFSFSYRADNYLKLRAIEEKGLEIETAIQTKNEILGIVAHDLRNPLTAIRTIATLMKSDVTMNADNQDNLEMIQSSCDRATSIINDLIESANNENDNVFDIEQVEINQYLLKIVDDWVKNTTGQANILYYGTGYPIYTRINMEKMHRVMDNLISNAIKFSGESDRVEIRLRDTEGEVYIDVKDFGLGIPKQLLPFIFDRFSRASRKGIRGEESVGLGLSIVKQIIEKHGGNIEVNSTEQQGTTFTINIKSIPVSDTVKAYS
ncbi:MAG: HAMP domain-containing sensor histidine kinase [Bacteroidota bacterium]